MALSLFLVLAVLLALVGLAGMVVAAVVLIRQARERDRLARAATEDAPTPGDG